MIERIIDFFRPNLTKVLGQFNKTIADLESIEKHQKSIAAKARATVAAAERRAAQADEASTKALAIAGNIKGLIGA